MATLKTRGILVILALLACVSAQQLSTDWPDYYIGDNGAVRWRFHCDFYGNNIGTRRGTGEQCGSFCIANQLCSHFTYFEGVCYLKRGPRDFRRREFVGPVCGFIPSRF